MQPGNSYSRASPAPLGNRESLVDVLDRVLDKGVVIAGDISISLLDIELLTLRIRLLIASADKAQEMGIDWWRDDPFLSGQAGRRRREEAPRLEQENEMLRRRLEKLESQIARLTQTSTSADERSEASIEGSEARP